MTEKIIVTTAHMEFPLCPTIFVGVTKDGWTVYARYRWGRLSVRIDPRNPPPHGGAGGKWIMDKQIDPAGIDGSMYYADLREHTADSIEWPAELSPRTFEEDVPWLHDL
jgi:hypothetical protein